LSFRGDKMRLGLTVIPLVLFALLRAGPVWSGDFHIENLDQPVSIAGAWRFQPGDDIAWAAADYPDRGWASLMVPRDWGRQGYDDFSGMAWYRVNLYFDLDDAHVVRQLEQAGVTLGKIHSAYELYAGGELLGSIGKLPPHPEMRFDEYRTYAIPAAAIGEDGKVSLAIRVWGQDIAAGASSGGAYEGPFKVGKLPDLYQDIGLREVASLMLISVYVLFGLYHLYLYGRNPQLKQYLWFGLLAILIASYSFSISQWKHSIDLPFLLLKKFEYGVIYLMPAVFMAMIWSLLEVSPPRWARIYQSVFPLLALGVVLIPGFAILFRTLHTWQLTAVPVVFGMLVLVIQKARDGHKEARTMLPGMLVVTVSVLNDILVDYGILQGPRLLTFGFMAILVSVALSMANHFTRMFNHLEQAVHERTRELSELNEKLGEAAAVDDLTGILNRRGFAQKVDQEIARVGRSHRGFVLIMADIDYFKAFNDQYGHACGDTVLEQVAALLSQQLRDVDTIARWGGEEFILLLPETTLEGGEILAEKLRWAVETHHFQYRDHQLGLTLTFGVAQYRSDSTLDDCLGRADRALYQGKELGRNRVEAEVNTRQIDLYNTG
jgi:diguanylate cyclase (GGDEF)-like protein